MSLSLRQGGFTRNLLKGGGAILNSGIMMRVHPLGGCPIKESIVEKAIKPASLIKI